MLQSLEVNESDQFIVNSSHSFKIYYHTLCPFSRMLRIILREKGIVKDLKIITEKFWEWNESFLVINPSGSLPVMINNDGIVIKGLYACIEYLEEIIEKPKLVHGSAVNRAIIRADVDWFNNKMYHEATKHLVQEKAIKIITKKGLTNSTAIRAAKKNIFSHLDYIGYLLEYNHYLHGDNISLVDCAAAAQISILDYLGDISWEYNAKAKEWYALMKSRPSMKDILAEEVSGLLPPIYYRNPDF